MGQHITRVTAKCWQQLVCSVSHAASSPDWDLGAPKKCWCLHGLDVAPLKIYLSTIHYFKVLGTFATLNVTSIVKINGLLLVLTERNNVTEAPQESSRGQLTHITPYILSELTIQFLLTIYMLYSGVISCK